MFSLRVLVSVLYVQSSWLVSVLNVLSSCVGECLVCSVYMCW